MTSKEKGRVKGSDFIVVYPQRFKRMTLGTKHISEADQVRLRAHLCVHAPESGDTSATLYLRSEGSKPLGCSSHHSATAPTLYLHQPPFTVSFLLEMVPLVH